MRIIYIVVYIHTLIQAHILAGTHGHILLVKYSVTFIDLDYYLIIFQ